jgi:vacuolar iron transporter family protein
VLGADDGIVSVAAGTPGTGSDPGAALTTWPIRFRPLPFVAVLGALALTGAVSARIGGSNPRRAVIRVLIGGAAGLGLTYGIGHLFGTSVS